MEGCKEEERKRYGKKEGWMIVWKDGRNDRTNDGWSDGYLDG